MRKKNQNTLDMIRETCIYNWQMNNAINGIITPCWWDDRSAIVRPYLEHAIHRLFKVPLKTAIMHEIIEPDFHMILWRRNRIAI